MINVKFTEDINDLVTENLYQWDTYQTLKISGINFDSITPRVHFANKKSKEALVVKAILKSDGTAEVSIPNSLLTEKYDILAYIYTNTGLTYKTIKSITIPVISRLKPSEYFQPTNEEIIEIEEIELQAKLILSKLYASEYKSNEKYSRPNIVYYNHSSYMCLSNSEITGILPTDTSKWQLIAEGAIVTSLTKDSNGNLVFNFNNGSSFTVEMAVKDAKLVDGDDVPALKLTSEDVDNVKNIKNKKLYRHHIQMIYENYEEKTVVLFTIYNYSNVKITSENIRPYLTGQTSATGYYENGTTYAVYGITGAGDTLVSISTINQISHMLSLSGFTINDNVQMIL